MSFFDDMGLAFSRACARDINADLLNPTCREARLALGLYNQFGMSRVINEPTRITTLIDHAVVPNTLKVLDSFVGQLLPADHSYVGMVLDLAKARKKAVHKRVRCFKDFDPV